jgi:hypothetical protein
MRPVIFHRPQMRDAGEVYRLIEPGRNLIRRDVPVVRNIGVGAGYDKQKAVAAVGELDQRVLRCEMNLHNDGAVITGLDHERYVRAAWPVDASSDDHAEAARGRETHSVFTFDLEGRL